MSPEMCRAYLEIYEVIHVAFQRSSPGDSLDPLELIRETAIAAKQCLDAVGEQRLNSEEFWQYYREGRETRSYLGAIHWAIDQTPEMGPSFAAIAKRLLGVPTPKTSSNIIHFALRNRW